MTTKEILTGIQKRELRALSRLISLAENEDPTASEVLNDLYEASTRQSSRVIGITGPPGAGKSTLLGQFIRRFRSVEESVAVVAVDPVSPFSGGAILGDRIRLADHFNDPNVFIRSLSTRGKLGGLSLASHQAIHAFQAYGAQNILVETVGVGQSEVEIRNLADLTVVVLVPEWGDSIQALKSGILEIGDVFLVNKADRDGADRVINELRAALQMSNREKVPVLATSASDVLSLDRAHAAILSEYQNLGLDLKRRRDVQKMATFRELVERELIKGLKKWSQDSDTSTDNPYSHYLSVRKSLDWSKLIPK